MVIRAKKIQRSVHFDPELDEIIRQRSIVNNRGFSNEIENMLRKQLQHEAQTNKEAIAGRSTRTPTE